MSESAIDTLLALDGSILDQEDGYWIKIDAQAVTPSADIPHGVRYSLTLHGPSGKRILGYDNAHGVKPPRKFKFAGKRFPFDHRHRTASDTGIPYEFTDARQHQVVSNSFAEADRVLAQAKLK